MELPEMIYPLALHTSLGYVDRVTGADCLANVDVPMQERVIWPMGFDEYRKGSQIEITRQAVFFVRVYKEYMQYRAMIEGDVAKLNAKYAAMHLHFAEVKATNTIETLLLAAAQRLFNAAPMAQLKYHRPKLFDRVMTNLVHVASLKLEPADMVSPFKTTGTPHEVMSFGVESRSDGSIFERAFHHYARYMKKERACS